MSSRFNKKISAGKAALLVLLALGIVQFVWWRGLVYRPKGTSSPQGAPGGGGPAPLIITGLESVLVSTYIGDSAPGDADGPGYAARLDRPTGLALDAQGNLYVADTGNHRIRKISPAGIVSTLAGSVMGSTDGPALQACFNAPCGVCVAPDGTVYVADTGNNAIRRIQNGQVTTLPIKISPADHSGSLSASLDHLVLPLGVAYVSETTPYLLVADTGNSQVLRVSLDGTVANSQILGAPPTSVMAGIGVRGSGGTPLTPTTASAQVAVALPGSGTLMLGTNALKDIPIEGAEGIADVAKRPALRHPTAMYPLAGGWLLTDGTYGAVFLMRKDQAQLLAGTVSSDKISPHSNRDGDGVHVSFSSLCGIVTDGKRYVYVSDTPNNTIRRLTMPDELMHGGGENVR